jgi:hypothetical protein
VPSGSITDAVAAIRAQPHGGMDDSTRRLELPPAARAAGSPAIAALRWGAFGYGLLFAAPAAFDGSYQAVVATAVCLFVTTWRTVIPVRLGSPEPAHAAVPFLDVAVLGIAVGYDGGLGSPYFFCVLAAVVVLAFGWGAGRGAAGLGLAVVVLGIGTAIGPTALSEQWDDQRDLAALMVLVIGTAAAAFARHRLVDSESRRAELVGQVDRLSETNNLLVLRNRAARTLHTSLTLR